MSDVTSRVSERAAELRREFDRAFADLTRGGKIDGTIYGIWYHLGVIQYLRGDFADAAASFARAQPIAPDAGELAGSTDWLWMSLSRAGRAAEAKAMLDRRPDSKPVTNAYTRRLQLYRGEIGPEAVVTPADTDEVQVATLAYQRTTTDAASLFAFVDSTRVSGIDTSVNWFHRFSQFLSIRLKYQFTRLATNVTPNFSGRTNVSGLAGIIGGSPDEVDWGPPNLIFSSGVAGLSSAQYASNRNRTHAWTTESSWSHGRHYVTFGGDIRRLQVDIQSQQDARGTFSFTGAATGSAGGRRRRRKGRGRRRHGGRPARSRSRLRPLPPPTSRRAPGRWRPRSPSRGAA